MRKEDWINISDKLPEMGVWVLVYAFNSFIWLTSANLGRAICSGTPMRSSLIMKM